MWSTESREKSRIAHLGKKYKPMSEIGKRNIKLAHKGLPSNAKGKHWKINDTSRMKGRIGAKHPRWVADRTQLAKRQERNDTAYKDWRRNVWIRDNFKCKISNKDCAGRIEAHHILSWKDYPELRYEINNGITLCHAHHPWKHAEVKLSIPQFKRLIGVA